MGKTNACWGKQCCSSLLLPPAWSTKKYPRIFFISCQYSIEKRQGLREGVVDEDDDANRQAEACPWQRWPAQLRPNGGSTTRHHRWDEEPSQRELKHHQTSQRYGRCYSLLPDKMSLSYYSYRPCKYMQFLSIFFHLHFESSFSQFWFWFFVFSSSVYRCTHMFVFLR